MRLILASSSPYRRQMLMRLGLPFEVRTPNVDETPVPGEDPQALALRLARSKAQVIAATRPDAVVIGSDQVAVFEGQIIGKPGHYAAARAQLQQFSGHCVVFHSALCLIQGPRTCTASVPTECQFLSLTDAQIEHYLSTEQPYDTAGSAKAEGLGIALMARMRSDDPTAIIGLPLIALTRLLRQFGLDPLRPNDCPEPDCP